jgi:hypothetical protein
MLNAIITLQLKEPELVPLDESVKVEVIKYILDLDAGITRARRDAAPEFQTFTIEGEFEDAETIGALVQTLRENPYIQSIAFLKIYELTADDRLLIEKPKLAEQANGAGEKSNLGFLGI